MTVQDLKELSNEMVGFSVSSDSVFIRSWPYKYADMVHISDVGSVEMVSPDVVRISVPVGTMMGDHEILADLNTGVVTADGKVFDEPMPEYAQKPKMQKKTRATFHPSINGFSIRSVKSMPSEDGYAVYCKVYFNDRKIGDFVDKGDGSEYSFHADPPYSRARIEDVIRSFPPTNRDYGLEPMKIPYDMNQMVNDLMEMKEIAKALKRLEGSGRDYVLIDEWKSNRHFNCTPSNTKSDDELSETLRIELSKKGLSSYEIRRYISQEDVRIVNTFVCREMIC